MLYNLSFLAEYLTCACFNEFYLFVCTCVYCWLLLYKWLTIITVVLGIVVLQKSTRQSKRNMKISWRLKLHHLMQWFKCIKS